MRRCCVHAVLGEWYFSDFRSGPDAFFSSLSEIRIETGTPLMFAAELVTI